MGTTPAALKGEAIMTQTFLLRSLGDELRGYEYDSETKQQSIQWNTPNLPCPRKARQVRSNINTMLICFLM